MTTTKKNKGDWKSDNQDRVKDAHTRLAEGVAALRTREDWVRWLQQASAFHNYSFNNLILTSIQRPDWTRIAGASAWHKLGRRVLDDEWDHPIWIFAPMTVKYSKSEIAENPKLATRQKFIGWKMVKVYDLAQTDGAPLAEHPKTVLLEGDAPIGGFDALVKIAHDSGFTMTIDDDELGDANGMTDFTGKAIKVRSGMSDAQTFKTGVHEIAHMRLHGPDGDREAIACRADGEVEAESIAFILCDHFGITSDMYSFGYVAGWSGRDAEAVERAGGNITRTSRWLIDTMESIMEKVAA